MKKLYETITAFTLLLMYLRSYRQTIEAPEPTYPSKCSCDSINDPRSEPVAFIHCTKHNKTFINDKYVRPIDTTIRPVYIKDNFSLIINKEGYITKCSNDKPKEDMQVYRYPPVSKEQLEAYYKDTNRCLTANPYIFKGLHKDKNLY